MDQFDIQRLINQKTIGNAIEFSKDLINFENPEASSQYRRILQGKIDNTYKFYGEKSNFQAALIIKGHRDLVIDGKVAIIHVSGMLIPFYVEDCENIIFQNFTIQYDTLTHSEGIVIRRGITSFDIKLSQNITSTDSVPIMAWIEYDPETRLLGKKEAYANTRGEILNLNTIRVTYPKRYQRQVPKVGHGIILRHIITHHAGIQLFN